MYPVRSGDGLDGRGDTGKDARLAPHDALQQLEDVPLALAGDHSIGPPGQHSLGIHGGHHAAQNYLAGIAHLMEDGHEVPGPRRG
jgi:hypothetical protein